jgi:hypothetical protein
MDNNINKEIPHGREEGKFYDLRAMQGIFAHSIETVLDRIRQSCSEHLPEFNGASGSEPLLRSVVLKSLGEYISEIRELNVKSQSGLLENFDPMNHKTQENNLVERHIKQPEERTGIHIIRAPKNTHLLANRTSIPIISAEHNISGMLSSIRTQICEGLNAQTPENAERFTMCPNQINLMSKILLAEIYNFYNGQINLMSKLLLGEICNFYEQFPLKK